MWKEKQHFKIFAVYNPPNNNPDTSLIEISTKTILIGDFNAHAKEWGYANYDRAGRTMMDFLSSNTIDLIYNNNDIPTFLHYCGSTTNPDLTITSSDISSDASRKMIEDPGCGHRIIITTIDIKARRYIPQKNSKFSWNYKRPNGINLNKCLKTYFLNSI